MTRRYLLDSGPAFDFLFRRRGVDLRAEERTAQRRQGGHLHARPCGDCRRAGGQWQPRGVVGYRPPPAGQAGMLALDKKAASNTRHVFADLKRRGRPMQQIDMMMAPAMAPRSLGNCPVVSGDSDLEHGLGPERGELGYVRLQPVGLWRHIQPQAGDAGALSMF